MKVGFSLILSVVLTLIAVNGYAQKISLTTTKTNVVASRAVIDLPGLAGNANAIIVATPLGETKKMNPHQVGAWYYNDKWHIFNTDHATMPFGLQYEIQISLKPDANHLMHLVTEKNLLGDASYIDNPALNNNPNAQLTIFLNYAPDYRSDSLNKFEAQAVYNPTAGKWTIKNAGGERLYPNAAYNIVIASGGTVVSPPILPTTTPYIPIVGTTLLPPTLNVVLKTEWTVPPQGSIAHSSGLCKIVYGTYNNPNILATDTVIVTGQAELEGAYLHWTATVANGAIHFNVCNWKQMTLNAQAALYLNGRKVNILVLR